MGVKVHENTVELIKTGQDLKFISPITGHSSTDNTNEQLTTTDIDKLNERVSIAKCSNV